MENLNGNYYVEVKDKGYSNHRNEETILREHDPPKSFRTQYQVQNETEIKKIRNLIKMIIMNYKLNDILKRFFKNLNLIYAIVPARSKIIRLNSPMVFSVQSVNIYLVTKTSNRYKSIHTRQEVFCETTLW